MGACRVRNKRWLSGWVTRAALLSTTGWVACCCLQTCVRTCFAPNGTNQGDRLAAQLGVRADNNLGV